MSNEALRSNMVDELVRFMGAFNRDFGYTNTEFRFEMNPDFPMLSSIPGWLTICVRGDFSGEKRKGEYRVSLIELRAAKYPNVLAQWIAQQMKSDIFQQARVAGIVPD